MKMAKKLVALMLALVMAMGCMVTAFAADLKEDETKNDTVAGANKFGKDDEITGALDSTGDVDYYSFTVDKMGLVTVTLQHNKLDSDSTYFEVVVEQVASPSNKVITAFDSKGTDITTTSASFGANKGTYIVKVSMGAAHDADLNYVLSYDIENVAYCEVESNDTIETATKLEYASDLVVANAKKHYATISSATDTDYFKMEVPEEGIVYFFIENDSNAKGAYKVSLETHTKSNGSPVEKTLGSIEIGKDKDLANSACVGVSKGSYYFEVKGVDSTGGYKLFATFIPFKGVEHEYNGDIKNANMLSVGDTVQGSIFSTADADYYQIITTSENATFTIKAAASAGTGTGKWKVRVLNASGTDVAGLGFNFTDETGNSFQFTDEIPAGTYFIVVEGPESGIVNTGLYTLSIVDDEEPAGVMGLLDTLKNIDWSTFLGNFAGWFEQLNILGMITNITESIIKLIARL